jgi:hypothetical protein
MDWIRNEVFIFFSTSFLSIFQVHERRSQWYPWIRHGSLLDLTYRDYEITRLRWVIWTFHCVSAILHGSTALPPIQVTLYHFRSARSFQIHNDGSDGILGFATVLSMIVHAAVVALHGSTALPPIHVTLAPSRFCPRSYMLQQRLYRALLRCHQFIIGLACLLYMALVRCHQLTTLSFHSPDLSSSWWWGWWFLELVMASLWSHMLQRSY